MTVDRNPNPKSDSERVPPPTLPPWWLPPTNPGRERPDDIVDRPKRETTQALTGWPRVFPGL